MSDHTLSPEEQQAQMARVTDVQARYADLLMRKKNVVGVGVGLTTDREDTDYIYCLVVMVSTKVPEHSLDHEDQIPEEIEGVPVEVREVGTFMAQ